MYDVKCPYCDVEIEICHDDGYGMEEGEWHQWQCHKCDKFFVFDTNISIDHTAKKADCLNGEPHKYEKTHTWPKEYARMRCVECGDETPLPKGETIDNRAAETGSPKVSR